MFVVNLRNAMVQFDSEDDSREAVLMAVECINLALQRDPYGLGAQVFVDYENLQFEAVENVDEEE